MWVLCVCQNLYLFIFPGLNPRSVPLLWSGPSLLSMAIKACFCYSPLDHTAQACCLGDNESSKLICANGQAGENQGQGRLHRASHALLLLGSLWKHRTDFIFLYESESSWGCLCEVHFSKVLRTPAPYLPGRFLCYLGPALHMHGKHTQLPATARRSTRSECRLSSLPWTISSLVHRLLKCAIHKMRRAKWL